MKKPTKLCATFLTGALLLNSSAAVQVNASFSVDITQFILNNLEAVDDPYGMCEHTLSSNKSAYKIFQYTNVERVHFAVVYDPKYNFTKIQLSDPEKFDAVYEKYKDELDFDQCEIEEQDGITYVQLYDWYDESGNRTFDASDFSVKLDAVQMMCDELKAETEIAAAAYTYCIADGYGGFWDGEIDLGKTLTLETEGIKEIAEKYNAKCSDDDSRTLLMDRTAFDAALSLTDEIRTLYPDSGVMPICLINEGGYVQVKTPTIDLITGTIVDVLEYPVGDTNRNGMVDLTDATLILRVYAMNASFPDSAYYKEYYDVNQDGVIDLSDAAEVLNIYAASAAGIETS